MDQLQPLSRFRLRIGDAALVGRLCYPQLFPHLKLRSEEAQAATLETGKARTKRWLRLLDEHWLGTGKDFLCCDQLTIADYFGACLESLGETIKVDYSAYPNVKRWLDNVAKLPSWPSVNVAFYGLVGAFKDQSFVSLP